VGSPQPTDSNRFGTSGNLADIINHAKFNFDYLRGFDWASDIEAFSAGATTGRILGLSRDNSREIPTEEKGRYEGV
jgi:hypothetical protein